MDTLLNTTPIDTQNESSTETVQQRKLRGWLNATRPRVFTASLVPMGIAAVAAIEDGVFNLAYFVLALLGVMLLQTTANLVNEYADFKRGADERKEAGQSMTIKNKLLTPGEVLIGAVIVTVAACLIGVYFLTVSGPWLLAIGLSGVLVAITYTAGPYPLAYHGLGEVAAGIFMGPMIIIGAYYVMDSTLSLNRLAELCIISLPVIFTTAAILHANNIRDREADLAVGKHTLAVRFGIRGARFEYRLLLGLCYASIVLNIVLGIMPVTVLLAAVTVPTALRLVRIFDTHTDTLILHKAQGDTAKLHGQIGLTIVAGWLAWMLVAQLLIARVV